MVRPKKIGTSIRDLMPANYTIMLAQRTGCKNISNLSQIVRLEHAASKYWPAVVQLAREADPVGFAAWQAAQPGPVSDEVVLPAQ